MRIQNFIERLNLENEHAGEVKKLTQALQQFEAVQHKVKRREVIPKHLVRTWDIEHSFPDHEVPYSSFITFLGSSINAEYFFFTN